MIFNKGELFCGPGGLAAGGRKVGFESNGERYAIEHQWANDINEWACETFRQNICPTNKDTVFCKNVQELDIDNLPAISALTFGFPCNDFSIVGEQKGIDGEFGPLYTYGVKILRSHQPDWFLAENVSGLQSANKGSIFVKILRDLEDAGYTLTTHLYKFEEYGIPQCRHRILIVGIRNDLSLTFKVPAPTHIKNHVSCSHAINNPPISKDAPNNELTAHQEKVINMLSHIPPGKNAWCDELPKNLRLNVKGAKLSQIYKRLDPNLPAYTVTGSGGGGTHVYHWEEPRALTNRERARLQTFDDDYIFYGGKENVREQIGMAVPPHAAEIVFDAILKTFAKIEYDYVEPMFRLENDQLIKKII